jgi:hypothetical protein
MDGQLVQLNRDGCRSELDIRPLTRELREIGETIASGRAASGHAVPAIAFANALSYESRAELREKLVTA